MGNGNGKDRSGETADVNDRPANHGSSAARSVVGSMASDDPYLSLLNFETGYGDIGPAGDRAPGISL